MKAGNGQHFEPGYHAQAGLAVDSRLIVAANDKEQLPPTFQAIAPAIESVAEVLIDSGFVSEAAVNGVATDAQGRPTGVRVRAAVGRIRHGRTVADLAQRADPPAPPPEATFTARRAHRTAHVTNGAHKPANRPSASSRKCSASGASRGAAWRTCRWNGRW